MKNKKMYIILIGIYIIIAFILFFYYNFSVKKNEGYVILPGNNVFYKKNDQFTKIDKDFKENTYIKVKTIYKNSSSNLTFTIQDGSTKFFKNKESVQLSDDFVIAYSPKLDLTVQYGTIQELNADELKEVDTILREHDIIGYENLNVKQKVTFSDQTFYVISNLFDESSYDKVFSFVYYYVNGERKYLIEQVDSTNNVYNLCIPTVSSFVDFKHNNHPDMILSCEYFSDIGTDNYIYQMKDNIWSLLQ